MVNKVHPGVLATLEFFLKESLPEKLIEFQTPASAAPHLFDIKTGLFTDDQLWIFDNLLKLLLS